MYLEQIKSDLDLNFLKEGFFEQIFPKEFLDSGIELISLGLRKLPIESQFEEICYYFIKDGQNSKTIGIVGYCISKEKSKEAWISWFGILPEYRRKGYGTKALNFLLGILNTLKLDAVRVWVDNSKSSGSVEFYLNRCFIHDSVFKENLWTFKRGLFSLPLNWHGKPIGM